MDVEGKRSRDLQACSVINAFEALLAPGLAGMMRYWRDACQWDIIQVKHELDSLISL